MNVDSTQSVADGSRIPNANLVLSGAFGLQRAMQRTKVSTPALDPKDLADLLIDVAERRDRSAFGQLFRHFAPRVKAYVMRLGTAPAAAEDLAQDVMLTVWHRAEQFDRSKASPSTWIFTIARNRRIDVLRRERRPEIDPDDPVLVRDPDPAADDELDTAQQHRSLRTAVAKLPKEQGDLLRVAYFEDQSHSEIAARFDLPLGTVKSRLRLALAKLRPALEEFE